MSAWTDRLNKQTNRQTNKRHQHGEEHQEHHKCHTNESILNIYQTDSDWLPNVIWKKLLNNLYLYNVNSPLPSDQCWTAPLICNPSEQTFFIIYLSFLFLFLLIPSIRANLANIDWCGGEGACCGGGMCRQQ